MDEIEENNNLNVDGFNQNVANGNNQDMNEGIEHHGVLCQLESNNSDLVKLKIDRLNAYRPPAGNWGRVGAAIGRLCQDLIR